MERRQKLNQSSPPAISTKLLAGGIAGASETIITVSDLFRESWIHAPTRPLTQLTL